ncbi:MAG: hypothetical protein IBX64_03965 [Actinobacteria bacterium]|nr:hypothetical protein [Actinomycetota bacterium]
MRRSTGPQSMEATLKTNRSAKDGARSSLHYGAKALLIHPSYQDVCGRHGRRLCDPGRTHAVPGSCRDKQPHKLKKQRSGKRRRMSSRTAE